jgi:hypothetical protein
MSFFRSYLSFAFNASDAMHCYSVINKTRNPSHKIDILRSSNSEWAISHPRKRGFDADLWPWCWLAGTDKLAEMFHPWHVGTTENCDTPSTSGFDVLEYTPKMKVGTWRVWIQNFWKASNTHIYSDSAYLWFNRCTTLWITCSINIVVKISILLLKLQYANFSIKRICYVT